MGMIPLVAAHPAICAASAIVARPSEMNAAAAKSTSPKPAAAPAPGERHVREQAWQARQECQP